MAYEMVVEGLTELMADAREAGMVGAPKLVNAAITNSTNKIQSEARSRAPHRTGTLQRSILTQVDSLSGQVAVQEKYGGWIETGTGIYGPYKTSIVPVRAKALRFTIGGQEFIRRSVKGMKPRPFFKPAIDASMSYIQDQFDKVAELIVNGLAGGKP